MALIVENILLVLVYLYHFINLILINFICDKFIGVLFSKSKGSNALSTSGSGSVVHYKENRRRPKTSRPNKTYIGGLSSPRRHCLGQRTFDEGGRSSLPYERHLSSRLPARESHHEGCSLVVSCCSRLLALLLAPPCRPLGPMPCVVQSRVVEPVPPPLAEMQVRVRV